MMRVLIVGAGGFIGRHVAGRLIADGMQVTAAGRDTTRLARLLPGAGVIGCELIRDEAEVWAARLAGVDALVNCAGVLGAGADYAAHDREARPLFNGAKVCLAMAPSLIIMRWASMAPDRELKLSISSELIMKIFFQI